jgi:hypothetical protein
MLLLPEQQQVSDAASKIPLATITKEVAIPQLMLLLSSDKRKCYIAQESF